MHYGNNKPRYIRYAIYAAAVVIVSLLQNSRGAIPEIMGARAILAVPLCVAISMHEREIAAAVFGALSGILLDVCAVNDGFNTIVLMAMAVVCSLLISRIMQNNIVTALVLSTGAVVVYFILYIIVNLLLSGAAFSPKLLLSFYLPSFIYTVVFVPLIYFITKRIYISYKAMDE